VLEFAFWLRRRVGIKGSPSSAKMGITGVRGKPVRTSLWRSAVEAAPQNRWLAEL
jgi:hypothetical protein